MARPPIIISNGGVKDKLNKPGVDLMDSIKELNKSNKATASWINCDYQDKNGNSPVPMIIWHLKTDKPEDLKNLFDKLYPQKNAILGDEIK